MALQRVCRGPQIKRSPKKTKRRKRPSETKKGLKLRPLIKKFLAKKPHWKDPNLKRPSLPKLISPTIIRTLPK